MSLTELNKRYEELLKENVSEPIPSKKLADLMTEMEGVYKPHIEKRSVGM